MRHRRLEPRVLRAVLFDWGGTLVEGGYDAGLAAAGQEAGLAALGALPGLPTVEALGARFRDSFLPELISPREDEVDYVQVVRALFRDLGTELDAADAWRFVAAEHEAWRAAHRLAPGVIDVLDALRRAGLAIGIVSNAFDPPALAHAELDRLGVSARVDVAVFSSETGKRKPHPAGFRRALAVLGVGPYESLFVGDRLVEDIHGAAALGLRTAHAVWFGNVDAVDGSADAVLSTPGELLAFVDVLRTA